MALYIVNCLGTQFQTNMFSINDRKVVSDGASRIVCGSLFQAFGPATMKDEGVLRVAGVDTFKLNKITFVFSRFQL